MPRTNGANWWPPASRGMRIASWPSSSSTGPSRDIGSICPAFADALPELLSEPDEKSFGATDVAESIRLLVLNHFADELRAPLLEPGERVVDVVHSEHGA